MPLRRARGGLTKKVVHNAWAGVDHWEAMGRGLRAGGESSGDTAARLRDPFMRGPGEIGLSRLMGSFRGSSE